MATRVSSGTGVVVSLVVFVLCTVFLLVLTIVFYSGQTKAMDDERPKFLEGAAKNGVELRKALEVWNLLDKFANYGFNKSHAAE